MLKKIGIFLGAFLAICLTLFVARLYFEAERSREVAPYDYVGLKCPKKPNCVSSLMPGKAYIAPFKSAKTLKEMAKILAENGIEVTFLSDKRLHGVARSALFGFYDDIDILFDAKEGVFQVRSMSRVGYSDLSANRNRLEALREKLRD